MSADRLFPMSIVPKDRGVFSLRYFLEFKKVLIVSTNSVISRARVEYEVIDNQQGAYYHLISNKRK